MFEAYTLKQEVVLQEAEELRHKIGSLSNEQRAHYFSRLKTHLKDPDTYATLNWLFLAGLHHFYLGNFLQGLINLCVMLAGIALCFLSPILGASVIGLIFLIELPALFRSQIIVEHDNNQRGLQLYQQILSESH